MFRTIKSLTYKFRKYDLKRLKRDCLFTWQRLTRGWSDYDTWNLDCTFAEFVIPRLKRYKDISGGGPLELSHAEWQEILDKMILAFEQIADQFKYDMHDPAVQEGLDLFRKYYFNLWW